jgi:hypothetical protein
MTIPMKSKFPALFFCVLCISFTNAAEDTRPDSTYPAAIAEDTAPAARAPVLIPGQVTRALFTRKVTDLEPVDTVSVLTNDITRITYFTEIHGMAGQTITHRWEFNGKIVLEKKHEVGSSRWRAYTTKTLDPTWLGEWKASVVDSGGGTLSVNTFTYMKKPDSGATPVSTAPNSPGTAGDGARQENRDQAKQY